MSTGNGITDSGTAIKPFARYDWATGLPAPSASSTSPEYVTPSAADDPVFDTVNGTRTSVTASATVITPPAGCKYVRVDSDVTIYVNTAGAAAVDDGTSIRILGGVPEVVPVIAATAVKALSSSGTATVRCMPYKARP